MLKERLAKQWCPRSKLFIYNYNRLKNYDLLPGDVFILEKSMTIPADCVLVQGEVVMNEGMLTGESVPVNKEPLKNNDDEFTFSLC